MSAELSTAQAAACGPAPIEPLKLSYVRVPLAPVKQFLARFRPRAVSWYAALFRDAWPLSALAPLPRAIGAGFRLVVRHEHVREVFSRHDVFRVPFGDEIARLNDGREPGTPFLLGVDDVSAHDEELARLVDIFPLSDAPRIEALAYESARARLQDAEKLLQAGEPFDAISGLLTAVPVDLCRDYYGVAIHEDERETFAHAAIELSGHLFGPPPIEPTKEGSENRAGDDVRAIVDRAIEREIAWPSGSDTVLARLVRDRPDDARTRLQARAVLVGMIVGFVPTNTIAGGHILEMLLRRRGWSRRPHEMMEESAHAAEMGDDDRLGRCLFEALRFMPINVGRFRICAEHHRIGGVLIRRGEVVLAMTESAMFDSRQVKRRRSFDPTRPASHLMHFGFGMHWCLGFMIARAQITQTFKALLPLHPERASPMTYWGGFPEHLHVTFRKR